MNPLRPAIATQILLIGAALMLSSCALPHRTCIEEQRVPVSVLATKCCGWDSKHQLCTRTCNDIRTEYQTRCLKWICDQGYVEKDGKCVEDKH